MKKHKGGTKPNASSFQISESYIQLSLIPKCKDIRDKILEIIRKGFSLQMADVGVIYSHNVIT